MLLQNVPNGLLPSHRSQFHPRAAISLPQGGPAGTEGATARKACLTLWFGGRPRARAGNARSAALPSDIAKEHGQHLTTMLSVYASWTEGAVQADVAAIRDAMIRTDSIERNAARDIPAMATRLDRLVTRPEGSGRIRRSDFSVADADPPPSDRRKDEADQ